MAMAEPSVALPSAGYFVPSATARREAPFRSRLRAFGAPLAPDRAGSRRLLHDLLLAGEARELGAVERPLGYLVRGDRQRADDHDNLDPGPEEPFDRLFSHELE